MRLARLGLAHPDRRQLRVAVGHPGNLQRVGAYRQTEHAAPHHQPRVRARQMGELAPASRVPHGEHPAVGAAQGRVGDDPVAVMGDAGLVEVEALQRRLPPHRHQQVRSGDPDLAAGMLQGDRRSRLDPDRLVPGQQLDAVRLELVDDDLGCGRVFAAQHLGGFDDHHLRAQPAERLAQLNPDWAAAQHDQAFRQSGQLKDGLVGEMRNVFQPRDRRNHRPRARRHHDLASLDLYAVAGDGMGVHEASGFADHRHPQAFKTRLAVHRRDGGDGGADMGHHRGKIDADAIGRDAQVAAVGRRVCGVGGGDQRLGRHAAIVQAVAAHLALFEQHDLEAQLGGAGGHRKSARPRPDHHEVRLECRR